MEITTDKLRNEDWEKDVYWDGNDFVVDLKNDCSIRLKNAYPSSIKFGFDEECNEDITISSYKSR